MNEQMTTSRIGKQKDRGPAIDWLVNQVTCGKLIQLFDGEPTVVTEQGLSDLGINAAPKSLAANKYLTGYLARHGVYAVARAKGTELHLRPWPHRRLRVVAPAPASILTSPDKGATA